MLKGEKAAKVLGISRQAVDKRRRQNHPHRADFTGADEDTPIRFGSSKAARRSPIWRRYSIDYGITTPGCS